MKLLRPAVFKSVMKPLQDTEREITINAPWGRIAGITWGHSDNPPVFICPGRISPCSSFRPLVVKLPSNFFYVTVDLPGNGLSDHLPMGTRFTFFDLVPTVARVSDHFKWKNFAYIGHSLGAVIGKHFMIAYPGRLTRVVDLDPAPAYHTVLPHEMKDWYHETFGRHYEQEGYAKHTGGKETAPKYTYEQIKTSVMKAQQLSEETVEHLLPRYIEKAGDGLYRFTYDQRMKSMFKIPYLPNQLKEIYTSYNVPLLTILASESVNDGAFSRVPFVQDESAWPFSNYKYKIVEGSHDVHTSNPDCMVEDISRFLLEDVKAKL